MKRIVVMIVILISLVNVVEGRVRYSPYAFSYHYPSGLVPDYVRYSPYAFSHRHPSGLIDSYSGYPYPYYFPPYDCPPPIIIQHQSISVVPNYQVPNNPEQRKEKREAEIRADRQRAKELKELRENDGKEIISAYLRSKNIAFRINNGFFVKNKTVSLDFFLEGRNIIIKYQNPEEIQMLGQRWTDWEDACAKNRPGGRKIYEIKSCQKDEILANLISNLK